MEKPSFRVCEVYIGGVVSTTFFPVFVFCFLIFRADGTWHAKATLFLSAYCLFYRFVILWLIQNVVFSIPVILCFL